MTGARGDVTEIDIINHYIGMQKLEDAAKNERALAPYVLIVLSLFAIIIAANPRKKISKILYLPIMGFPAAFVVIFYIWLYRFGHELNTAAPMRLKPFTPTILGTGIIGQFSTFAIPGLGFYLSCFSAVIIGLMIYSNNRRQEV
jgi:Na+/proline symporter